MSTERSGQETAEIKRVFGMLPSEIFEMQSNRASLKSEVKFLNENLEQNFEIFKLVVQRLKELESDFIALSLEKQRLEDMLAEKR